MKVSPGTRNAFTLLEVMIAVAIAGIVSGGLFTVFNTSFRQFKEISEEDRALIKGYVQK